MNPLNPGAPVNLIHEGKCYEFAFVSYAADGKHCALAKVTDVGCEYILTDVDLSVVYPSTQKEPTGDVFDITPGSTLVKFKNWFSGAKFQIGCIVGVSGIYEIQVVIKNILIKDGIYYYVCDCVDISKYNEARENFIRYKSYNPIGRYNLVGGEIVGYEAERFFSGDGTEIMIEEGYIRC